MINEKETELSEEQLDNVVGGTAWIESELGEYIGCSYSTITEDEFNAYINASKSGSCTCSSHKFPPLYTGDPNIKNCFNCLNYGVNP